MRNECLCDESSCSGGDRCFGQECFSSLAVINGTSVVRKGCILGDEDRSWSCRSTPTPQLVVKCCYGHLCNMNISLNFPLKGEAFAKRIVKLSCFKLCRTLKSNFRTTFSTDLEVVCGS